MPELGPFNEVTASDLIQNLNESDEHSRCEAKTSSEMGTAILDSVCAFANEPGLGGGYLLLGVAPADNTLFPMYVPVGLSNLDNIQKDLSTQCRTVFNRAVRPQIKIEYLSGKAVLVVFIPECPNHDKPIYLIKEGLPEGACRRIGSTDQRCTEEDLAVFYGSRRRPSLDSEPVEDATIEDIDPSAIATYRKLRAEINSNAEELTSSDDDLLLALGCVKPNGTSLTPTVAGVLLFGKPLSLRRLFPMFRIDYMRTNSREWVERPDDSLVSIEIREPLIRAISRTQAAILDDLPKEFSLPSGALQRESKPIIPTRVVREVVVNALMHRSYLAHSPVSIVRYPNRLEVRNAGHSLVADEQLGRQGSVPRNPVIAGVLYDVGYAETKGYGIRSMRKRMQDAGLFPPMFESDRSGNNFTAYLLFHKVNPQVDDEWLGQFKKELSANEQRGLILARELRAIDYATYRSLNDCDSMSASNDLRRLCSAGHLHRKGRGNHVYYRLTKSSTGKLAGKSTGKLTVTTGKQSDLIAATESADGSLPADVQEEIDTITVKSSKRLVRRAILIICDVRPMTPAEVAYHLNRKSIKTLSEKFISPLTKEGLLRRTYPDNLTHPGQSYSTTEKGNGAVLDGSTDPPEQN